jgi:hypothetical protein
MRSDFKERFQAFLREPYMRYESKLSKVAVDQLLTRLIHPSVFALLGLLQPLPECEKAEAEDITTYTYRATNGVLTVKVDGVRVLIEANLGDKPILRCALRDRQLDGTDKSSPLTFFPNTDPACNRLPEDFHAVELSIYSWDPNTYLDGLDVEGSVGHFIADPDFYVWKQLRPKTYFKLFEQVFFLGRAPWQTAKPMSGVPAFFVKHAVTLLKEIGYHRVDAVPSWYNVARFFKKLGFSFTYAEHELVFDALDEGLKQFGTGPDGKIKPVTRAQEAWLVALQNLPTEYIQQSLRLPARWPVTHTNQNWARMHVDLNPYAAPQYADDELMSKIKALRQGDGCAKIVMHTSTSHCPCTHTLGASSPAASGPAATPKAEE